MGKREKKTKGKIRMSRVLIWTVVIVFTAIAVGLLLSLLPKDDMDIDALLNETLLIETEAP
ncbi:MAG: hypothetical protein LIP11_08555 [Clostridiales bacterium]|nr:hypothetical protein [Clostridiales bacterium]